MVQAQLQPGIGSRVRVQIAPGAAPLRLWVVIAVHAARGARLHDMCRIINTIQTTISAIISREKSRGSRPRGVKRSPPSVGRPGMRWRDEGGRSVGMFA